MHEQEKLKEERGSKGRAEFCYTDAEITAADRTLETLAFPVWAEQTVEPHKQMLQNLDDQGEEESRQNRSEGAAKMPMTT